MFRIEVDERRGVWITFWLPPYLTQHSNIGVAHQYLPQYVQAVSSVNPYDVFRVDEWALSSGQVVIVIPMQGLPQEVLCNINNQRISGLLFESYQTVQMMQPFNVGRKPTSIFLADLDLIATYT